MKKKIVQCWIFFSTEKCASTVISTPLPPPPPRNVHFCVPILDIFTQKLGGECRHDSTRTWHWKSTGSQFV